MDNFHVILNGCLTVTKSKTLSIRKKYNISEEEFVFVFVGNIGARKNQKQVVNAYRLLPKNVKDKVKVLFVGGGDSANLQEYIVQLGEDDNLIVCGAIAKDDVHNYYIESDATILTSKSEGFGLSIIEGMVYGLPCLTFSDLPAIPDLFIESAMITVLSRSDKAVADGMEMMLNHKWDRDAIRKYSKCFSFEKMADKYINLYKQIL